MDNCIEALVIPDSPPLQASLAGLSRNTYLSHANTKPTVYTDVFVDNFLGLSQGPAHRLRHFRRTLFHALDKLFRPLVPADMDNLKEVLSLKKSGVRGLHLVHLPGSPGVGNIHRQHDAVLALTPVKPLQEDTLYYTPHS